jgi:glycosyltransferase involved in cell wall biosynthesis
MGTRYALNYFWMTFQGKPLHKTYAEPGHHRNGHDIVVSFVIPAYNEEGYIKLCLDTIIREIGGRPGYEIVVVDNNSNDKTCEIVAHDYPSVQLIHEPRRGANSAREAGFVVSRGELVAFLDADTELIPGWIDRAERAFAKDPNLVCISGPFIYYDLPFAVRALVQGFYIGTYLVYLVNNYIFRNTSMIQGGTEIVRRTALAKIGGHDVNLTFYGDDADLARRLRAVGHVRWSFDFAMRSSGRRLAKEGTFTMGWRYALNYFWITFFNKPFTMTSTEVRFADQKAMAYRPESRAKEWLIALSTIIAFFIIIEGLIYAFSRFRL